MVFRSSERVGLYTAYTFGRSCHSAREPVLKPNTKIRTGLERLRTVVYPSYGFPLGFMTGVLKQHVYFYI